MKKIILSQTNPEHLFMYFDNPADIAYKLKEQNFITRVYGWMCFALVITGLVAFYVASTPQMVYAIVSNKILFKWYRD